MPQSPFIVICSRLPFIFFVKLVQLCFELCKLNLFVEKDPSVKCAESSKQNRIRITVNVCRYSRVSLRVTFY